MKTDPIHAKNLTTGPPRSPRERISGYVILARCLDKGRAELNGTNGEFHFACPLDSMLFTFKGVKGDDIKRLLSEGADDQAVAEWLNTLGRAVTPEEIDAWSTKVEKSSPYADPGKREWFESECERLDLDPKTTTLFDYLDADDRQMALQAA